MGSRRKSVFERLGPLPADAPSPPPAVAEQQAQPLPKQRVALAHPLVARHLMLAQSEKAAAAVGAPPGLLGPAAVQQHEQHQRRQQQHRRRQRDRPHEQQRGSTASSSEGRQRRQQRDRSRGSQNGLQDELQRLQAERDAAEEMLGQMVSGSWEEDCGKLLGHEWWAPQQLSRHAAQVAQCLQIQPALVVVQHTDQRAPHNPRHHLAGCPDPEPAGRQGGAAAAGGQAGGAGLRAAGAPRLFAAGGGLAGACGGVVDGTRRLVPVSEGWACKGWREDSLEYERDFGLQDGVAQVGALPWEG